MPDPTSPKSGWGGKRVGAGRKPGSPKKQVRGYTAADILAAIDEINEWKPLLQSENEKIKLTALIYLTDRRDGKARQPAIERDGGEPQHEQFDLSKLSTEQLTELEQLVESALINSADASQRGETEP